MCVKIFSTGSRRLAPLGGEVDGAQGEGTSRRIGDPASIPSLLNYSKSSLTQGSGCRAQRGRRRPSSGARPASCLRPGWGFAVVGRARWAES